eukprot:1527876-Prymnesium_polylepis.3
MSVSPEAPEDDATLRPSSTTAPAALNSATLSTRLAVSTSARAADVLRELPTLRTADDGVEGGI